MVFEDLRSVGEIDRSTRSNLHLRTARNFLRLDVTRSSIFEQISRVSFALLSQRPTHDVEIYEFVIPPTLDCESMVVSIEHWRAVVE